MDMSNFRPELHIAQQSRRDKLRIQQDLGVYVDNNLGQISPHVSLNYESADNRSCRSGNICYDPSEFCSEMINFSVNPHGILKDGVAMEHHHRHQEPEKRAVVGEASFHHFSRENPMTTAAAFNSSGSVSSHDPQYFSSTWKSIGSQASSDWVANHSSIFVGDVKPNYVGYQELQHSPLNNSSGEMNGNSSAYQNALQELVTSSNARSFGLEFASLRQKSSGETGHGPWAVGGSELLLLPAYADQMRLKTHSDMMTRPVDGCSQWSGGELEFAAAKDGDRDLRMVANDNSNTQALSLSLSSVPSPKVHETQISEKDFQTRDVCGSNSTNVQDSRNWKPELPSPNPNLSTGGSRVLGTQQPLTHRNPGPLGPFTGYATILRSSKFLRPAQVLLEELCCIARPKDIEICDVVPDRIYEEVRVSREAAVSNAEQASRGAAGNSSVSSSFVFDGSSDKCREPGGLSCSPTDVYRPENLQKKAKLLYMQDEVCKRYKQYHQQMQMVVSSFESVAGLTAATPYVSLALKMISKHFRSLKNAITDQLKSIKNALGEESSSPCGSKGDATNVSMLKFFDQSFQKQKGAGNVGILEGQHIWRPQRGLPERAVSILRAWLFDHFLHPYPTDTDKHMLATQTGLTRNQVSNWFINARVRVWKPMVEEIHMLETKGMPAETGAETTNAAVEEGRDQGDGSSSQSLNRLRMRAVPDKQQMDCSRVEQEGDMWNQDKRSRIEYHDGSLMGLVPSHRSGIEMGGIGSVSLTLGLRQSAENGQRPPMQPERHLRPHFGGQIIRDFVG